MINSALSSIDLFIIILFMIATLYLGLRAGRGTNTVRDYAIANNSYSTPILFMTLTATFIGGGSTTGDVAEIFEDGLLYILAMVGYTLSQLIMARFIAPKFDERFDGMISVGDIIRASYGKGVERFSSIITCVYSVGIITAQVVALGHLVQVLIGVDYKISMLVMGLIMITYSTFGGIKAVTITDVLQFGVLVVTIPILAQIVLSDAGGISNIFENVKAVAPQKLEVINNKELFNYMALFVLYLMPSSLKPAAVQRFLMAKNKKVVTKLLYSYAFMDFCLMFIISCIAFSAVVLLGDVNPKGIIPTFISTYLPVGLKGLVIAGMIAAIMSTADSILNTAGVIFTHNLMPKKYNKIGYVRLFTFAIGIFALWLGLFDMNIVSIAVMSNSLLLLGVVLPTIMIILRFKVTPITYWVPIIITMPIFVLGKFVLGYGFKAQLALIVIAAAISILMVMYQNKWKNYIIQTDEGVVLQQQGLNFAKFFYNWYGKICETINSTSIPFAIFALTAFTLPYFMWSSSQEFNVTLRVIAGFLCISLLMRDYYPSYLKSYYFVLWIIALIYCLPFMTTVVVFTEGDNLWLINLALGIFLLAAIVDWLSFIVISVIGVVLGLSYVTYFDYMTVVWDNTTVYGMIYTSIFATLIGLVFNRCRERKAESKIDGAIFFAQTMAHEVKSPIASAAMNLEIVKNLVDEKAAGQLSLKANDLSILQEFIKNTSDSLRIGGHNVDVMLAVATAAENMSEDTENYAISEVIESITQDLEVIYSNYYSRIRFEIEEDFRFVGSKKMIQHVLFNLIGNSVKYALTVDNNAELTIKALPNQLIISDNGPGVPFAMQGVLFNKGSATNGSGLGLAFCKQVMNSLGGSIHYSSEKHGGAKFVLKFPKVYIAEDQFEK